MTVPSPGEKGSEGRRGTEKCEQREETDIELRERGRREKEKRGQIQCELYIKD